ncbi:MAG: 6-bladed beta-propeller [Bacteroidales bacterium]|nr:6-bladed beta-propeller [Bacteroidales bacterium]
MRIILLIAAVLIFARCARNNNQYDIQSSTKSDLQAIDLNKALEQTVYKQSDIIDSIKKIVFLETNDSSLIHPPILKIEVTDERIYISDIYQSMGLIIFDQNGKFIKRLPQGNGPGEIACMINFTFDKFANQLIVYGNPFVYLFDEDGNYIDVKIADFSADHILATADEYLFSKIPGHANPQFEGCDNNSIIVTDKNLNIKHMMCPYASNRGVSLRMGHIGDAAYISVPDGDTVYYYGNHDFMAKYAFDFSEHKVIPVEPTDPAEIIAYYSKPIEGFVFNANYLETEHHQVMNFSKGRYGYSLFRNKDNGHTIGGINCSRNFEEEIIMGSGETTWYNQFVSWNLPQSYAKGSLQSDKYVSVADRQKLDALDAEDNPFLVFYTLKDF